MGASAASSASGRAVAAGSSGRPPSSSSSSANPNPESYVQPVVALSGVAVAAASNRRRVGGLPAYFVEPYSRRMVPEELFAHDTAPPPRSSSGRGSSSRIAPGLGPLSGVGRRLAAGIEAMLAEMQGPGGGPFGERNGAILLAQRVTTCTKTAQRILEMIAGYVDASFGRNTPFRVRLDMDMDSLGQSLAPFISAAVAMRALLESQHDGRAVADPAAALASSAEFASFKECASTLAFHADNSWRALEVGRRQLGALAFCNRRTFLTPPLPPHLSQHPRHFRSCMLWPTISARCRARTEPSLKL